MFKEFVLPLKNQKKKERYTDLEVEITYFEESFIRTSIGNDGNYDDWGDEDAKPVGSF